MLIRTLKKLLRRGGAEEYQTVETPRHEEAAFLLRYGDLVVGGLRLREGQWEFRYSPEFIAQTDVLPLVDFPDPKKVYTNDDLWPFFLARLPSIEQPRIREMIDEEGLDAQNLVHLLRRFGTRTISNPFVLDESARTGWTGEHGAVR